MMDTPLTLIHVIQRRVADTPDRIAIVHEPSEGPAREITYLELWHSASAVAEQLEAVGNLNDRVVLLFPSGPGFAESFVGCLMAGRIAVPAAVPRNSRALERTAAIIRDSGAHTVLTTPSMLADLRAALSEVRLQNGKIPSVVAAENRTSGVRRDIVTCQPRDIAFLQYTSGSTASPRGVVVGHDNLIDNLQRSYRPFQFHEPAATMVSWLPAHHDMGLIGGLLEPFYSGCKTVLMSPSEFIHRPLKWLELITKHRGTISGGPNFAYEACVSRIRERDLEALDLSSWRVAYNGSEPIRAETLDRFASRFERCGFDGRAIFPCYGLAESTLMVTARGSAEYSYSIFDREKLQKGLAVPSRTGKGRTLVACGAPNDQHELVIADAETRKRRYDNEVGEIWLSGPSVCRGYWNRELDTARTFFAELSDSAHKKFLRTGDLGFMIGGQLYVSGRLKNIVIIRGLNYASEDIEDLAQSAHPAVSGSPCAAFSIDGSSGEELVIVQEVNRSSLVSFDNAEVVEAIQESVVLHHGIRARAILLVLPGSLPRTTSGKIQRFKARDLYLDSKLLPATPVPT